MYNPELGVFQSQDPLGYIDSMNLYAYCANNPLNYVDPWGLSIEGDNAARWALNQDDNPHYGSHSLQNGGFHNMCNRFIRDAYTQQGADYPHRRNRLFLPTNDPPSANELADPSYEMRNYPVINSSEKIKPNDLELGDIISYSNSGYHHSGHTMIYVGNGYVVQASSTRPEGASTTSVTDEVIIEAFKERRGTVRRYQDEN